MNWIVVGIGDVAMRRVLPAIADEPRSTLYGVVSRDEAKGLRHAGRVWPNLQQALADPAIDAVYLATPVFLHCGQAIEALQAGKHVLCEKPAALNYSEAAAMAAAAQSNGRTLGIAYFRRHYPKLVRAKQLLDDGAIGKPLKAFASCAEWFTGDPAREWLEDPSRAGSGPLYDIGSHRIDALNFLLGKPIGVEAEFFPASGPGTVESSASVQIAYEGGASATVHARWDIRDPWDEFTVAGSAGSLELSPLNGPVLKSPTGEEFLPCDLNRHYPCIAGFVASVLDRAPFPGTAQACLGTAWVLDRALRQKK